MPATPRFVRFLSGIVFATAVLLLSQTAFETPRVAALTGCDVTDSSLDTEEQAFLNLINGYRAQNGLQPLSDSANLNRSSAWMAVDLANNGYFSHTDSLGRSFDVRISACGGWAYAGENLAAGTVIDSAQEAFDIWRTSPEHNANMLTAGYQQIGIARSYNPSSPYGWYWVTDFSTSNDGTNGLGASTTGAKAQLTAPPSWNAGGAMFSFSPVLGAADYWIDIGSTPGSWDIFTAELGARTSVQTGSMTPGSTIYVRLSTFTPGAGWQGNDYAYVIPG